MNKELSKRQSWHFFLINVTAFALIFLSLGLIVFQMLNSSSYKETDNSLEKMSIDTVLIEREIQRVNTNNPFLSNVFSEKPPKNLDPNRFNTQVLLWSKDGTILNKDVLGGRFTELQSLKLEKSNLNKIEEITTNDSLKNKLYFHSITVKANETVQAQDVAYIQFLANTDQIKASVANFRSILIVCMIIFWLLSIAISYYVSKLNMRPIIQAWRKQQEFVENASHELRTPLTIIQNKLQRLFVHPDHTVMDESESIAQALGETRRLTGLTNDLLTIARSDSNQEMLEKEAIQIQPFLDELTAPFKEIAQLEEKELIVTNSLTKNIMVDKKRIHQVLVILLDNAFKYTHENDQIILSSSLKNQYWQIDVANTGPAIKKEDQLHIFDRFYREDKSRTKETGGYGLGLAIAKQIVENHHGQIKVRDYQPKGVLFQLLIPIK